MSEAAVNTREPTLPRIKWQDCDRPVKNAAPAGDVQTWDMHIPRGSPTELRSTRGRRREHVTTRPSNEGCILCSRFLLLVLMRSSSRGSAGRVYQLVADTTHLSYLDRDTLEHMTLLPRDTRHAMCATACGPSALAVSGLSGHLRQDNPVSALENLVRLDFELIGKLSFVYLDGYDNAVSTSSQ